MASLDQRTRSRHLANSHFDQADSSAPSVTSPATTERFTTNQFSRRHRDDSPDPIKNSNWFDVPLAFALVPAVGSLLTGSDLLKDFLHLAFLLYYLHNLIKVPWTLYISARSRRADVRYVAHGDDHVRALARSELRLAELTYLVFTIIAPFLGALLLRSVSRLLSIDTVSTFSTSLFVLATGIRPWRHLVDLLRHRTETLHDVVHFPPEDSLHIRLERMEGELQDLRALLETKADGQNVLEVASNSLDVARKEIKKSEQQAALSRVTTEARLQALEVAAEIAQRAPSLAYPSYSVVPDKLSGDTAMTITVPRPALRIMQRLFDWLTSLLSAEPSARTQWSSDGKSFAELVEVDDDDDDDVQGDKPIHRPSRGSSSSFQQESGTGGINKVVEFAIHFALSPLRLIRLCALLILHQLR